MDVLCWHLVTKQGNQGIFHFHKLKIKMKKMDCLLAEKTKREEKKWLIILCSFGKQFLLEVYETKQRKRSFHVLKFLSYPPNHA